MVQKKLEKIIVYIFAGRINTSSIGSERLLPSIDTISTFIIWSLSSTRIGPSI